MSAPTKGMVAGKPIVTGALTQEYEAGHTRTFGEPKPFPRGVRMVWDTELKKLVPYGGRVSDDAKNRVFNDQQYWGAKAPDGSDIGSRTKHRAYMRATGMTTTDDYSDTWKRQENDRAKFFAGEDQPRKREIRETLGRALYEAEKRSR